MKNAAKFIQVLVDFYLGLILKKSMSEWQSTEVAD